VLVDGGGRVLTNHHVAGMALSIQVELQDGRRLPAALLATEPRADLCLLQLQAPVALPSLPWGDSEALRVGEPVWTVGHPMELPWTATSGMISALHRRGLIEGDAQDFIQFDAPVSPGASGGPLLNRQGQLVGLVSAIYEGDGSAPAEGISLAIPSRQLKAGLQALLEGRAAGQAALGLELDPSAPGLRLRALRPGGAAERAGLAPGDVLLRIDGEALATAEQLSAWLLPRYPGEEIELELLRAGRPERRRLSLEPRAPWAASGPAPLAWAGAEWAVEGEALRLMRVGPSLEGSGLRPGDLLLSVQGRPPDAAARATPGPRVLALERQGQVLQALVWVEAP
jgi:serine protease Do/serine protease DegQ